MTFPCLVCGDLPIVDQSAPQQSSASTTSGARLSSGIGSGSNAANTSLLSTAANGTNRKSGGATIRTLSKDVSDKIFQNLCRHLYVKPEPYWFIQNPGEQMPLCAFCSGMVLEIYTLQTKVDQFQAMTKKIVCKLERIVADTEIAGNWMATREEQEGEEDMWNNIPCPPMAIRIARERHHKFRQQILQNFKGKVKLWRKMRASGQQGDELYETETPLEPTFENGDKPTESASFVQNQQPPPKKSRLDETSHHQVIPGLIRAKRTLSPTVSARSSPSSLGPSNGVTVTSVPSRLGKFQSLSSLQAAQQINIPSTISLSTVGTTVIGDGRSQMEGEQEYLDDAETEDDQNSQMYPDVQIVCSAGPSDYFKEEQDYSNSGDGDDSTMEQEGGYWNSTDENMDDADGESMIIAEGEDAVYLAPGLALRKYFINQLLTENLKPSVFLRKLIFAVFGMKQVANSSGICGSNKPGAKPSLDRYKFEALREYTIETYGIRDNLPELEDLNRKIRTICCDARKALKRKTTKTTSVSSQSNIKLDSLANAPSTSATSIQHHLNSENMPPPPLLGNIPDLFQLATAGSLKSAGDHDGSIREDQEEPVEEDDDNQLQHIPVSVTLEEHSDDIEIHP